MIRFFGSSAPAIGAGPVGQLDSLRTPARIAAAKLIASFLVRLAASLGAMLSPATGSTAASVPVAVTGGVVAAPDGVLAVAAGTPIAAAESRAEAGPLSTGVGADATSPPLTPERGASAAQAVSRAIERTPAREKR